MDSSDPLKEFLQNTGWSCDELLQKLLQIKSQSSTSQEMKDEATKQNHSNDSIGNSQTVTASKPKRISISTNSNVADKDFSDTDDEEKEVLITNTHIIEEIIEDISDDNPAGHKEALHVATRTKDHETSSQDHGVIELDSEEEEEDDNFEEECCHSSKKTEMLANSGLSKEKSSNIAEKGKVDSDSTIVIEDDDIADTEKTVVSFSDCKNDSSNLNEMLASASIIRTDCVDKNRTDSADKNITDDEDEVEVISIEDVYDDLHLRKQMGRPIEVEVGVEQSSVEKAWQLPTILSMKGSIYSKIKSNTPTSAESCEATESANNRKGQSLGSTDNKISAKVSKKSCMNKTVQSRSRKGRTEIGRGGTLVSSETRFGDRHHMPEKTSITDIIQRRLSNIDSNQSTTESCMKKDKLPVPKSSTTFEDQISSCVSGKLPVPAFSHSLKNEHSNHNTISTADQAEKPSISLNTDFEDVIHSNNQFQKPEQSSLVQTLQQEISVQKPARHILFHAGGSCVNTSDPSVSKDYTSFGDRDQLQISSKSHVGKTSNRKRTVTSPVPMETASVYGAEKNSTKEPPIVIAVIEDKKNETSAESSPAKIIDVTHSTKHGWELPTIVSVEGAVEMDEIRTDGSRKSLLQQAASKTTTMTFEGDVHVARTDVAKPMELLELSTSSIFAETPNGSVFDVPPADVPGKTANQNQDIVIERPVQLKTQLGSERLFGDANHDRPKTVKDPPQLSKTPPDCSTMGSKVKDSSNVLECSIEKPTRIKYLKPLLESSELSPTENTFQGGLKTVRDSTTLSTDSKVEEASSLFISCLNKGIIESYSPEKDKNQNPVQQLEPLMLSPTVRGLDGSQINTEKDANQDVPKIVDDLSGLLEETTDTSTINSKNTKDGKISDTLLRLITELNFSDKKDIQNQEPSTEGPVQSETRLDSLVNDSDQNGPKTDEDSSKILEGKLNSSTTNSKSSNTEEISDIISNSSKKAIAGLDAQKETIIQNQKSAAGNLVQQKTRLKSLMRAYEYPDDSQIDITEGSDQNQSETFKYSSGLSKRTSDPSTECSLVGKVGKFQDQKYCSEVTTTKYVFEAEESENSLKSLEKSSKFVHKITILEDDLEDKSTRNDIEANLKKSNRVLILNASSVDGLPKESPQNCVAEDTEISLTISEDQLSQVSVDSLHNSSRTEGNLKNDIPACSPTNTVTKDVNILTPDDISEKEKLTVEGQIEVKISGNSLSIPSEMKGNLKNDSSTYSSTKGITEDVDISKCDSPDRIVQNEEPAIESQIEPKTPEKPLGLLKASLDTIEHLEVLQKTDKNSLGLSKELSDSTISSKFNKVADIDIEEGCSKSITEGIGTSLTDYTGKSIQDQSETPKKMIDSQENLSIGGDSEMESNENDSPKSSTKLISADVESSATEDIGNKASPEREWMSDIDADSAISQGSAVEEVEYRLVDPHVVDNPNSGDGVDKFSDVDAVNALSCSSTDDYGEFGVESLENTSAAEDTDPIAGIERTSGEDDILLNNKIVSHPSTLSIDLNTAARNEYRSFIRISEGDDNSIRNKRTEKIEDVEKVPLTISGDKSQRSKKPSMADIIQRRLTMEFSSKCNDNEEAVSADENGTKRLMHINIPTADCRRNTVDSNYPGNKPPTVSSASSATEDGNKSQVFKKTSIADIIHHRIDTQLSNKSNDEEAVSMNENENEAVMHKNVPIADCRRNTEPVLEHVFENNDAGKTQHAVSTDALVDINRHQIDRSNAKVDAASLNENESLPLMCENVPSDDVQQNFKSALKYDDGKEQAVAPTKQLPESVIDVMRDHKLLNSQGTKYSNEHQLDINEESRNDLSSGFLEPSAFASVESELAKVSNPTALHQRENEFITEVQSSDLSMQAPKNTTIKITDNRDVEYNKTSIEFATSQTTTKRDTNSQKNYMSEKGEKGEVSKESKPSTPTSGIDVESGDAKKALQEEVVFAVPKLPPLRASSSKNNEMDIGNVETIRMNLKLQLDSLRNRKRQHVKITTKIDNSFFEKSTSNQSEETSIIKEPSCSENIPQLQQDQLYTQTNELGLVILDVQGGVEELDDHPVVGETDAAATTAAAPTATTAAAPTAATAVQKRSEQIVQEEDEKNEVEDLVRQIISKKGEPKIRIRKDLTKLHPAIDDFEIFQKGFSENIDNASSSITAELRPSTSTTKTHDEDINTLESALFAGENFQLNDKSLPPNEEKSPFVSNTLDEFLTGDAQLNVSYNIPKCDAEEGIRELRFESEPLHVVLKKAVELKHDIEGSVQKFGKKVRTLAQKRKLLEKQMAREKRQQEKEQEKEKIGKEKQEKQKELEDKNKDRSYVIEGGKKIWVNSFLTRRCVANIDEVKSSKPKINLPQSPRQKRISLLENLHKKHKVKYSPGPLSKKHVLQVGGTSRWKTEVKSLPKVFVEVVPKLGQPLPPELLGRIDFDENLCENHIDFALTALKTKNPPMEPARKFVLPVRYGKNQRRIMVRKKVAPPAPQEVKPIEEDAQKVASQSDDDDDTVIAKVVDDMISYVEIKEIAPSLVKDDDYDFTDDFQLEKNKAPIVDKHLSVMKRSQKKRSKVDAELIRLSCKIVSVEVEKEEEEKPCNKPYCRLGCVCKSLRCENTMIFHCQNEKCMFSCACPKERQPAHEHRVTLPAGTNVLSTDTVSRIEDEAKKHLARVEREFTQTIIQTNNRTIVVGASGRSKPRRAAQLPKKYSDYVDDTGEDDIAYNQVDLTKKCVVGLTRLNFDAIIPFCLRHNQYDCFCRCLSDYQPRVHVKPLTAGATAASVKTQQPGKKIAGSVDKGKQKKNANENVADPNEFVTVRHNHSDSLSKKRSYSPTDVTRQHNSNTRKRTEKEINDDGSTSTSSLDGTEESPVASRPVRNKKAKLRSEYEYPEHVQTCARAMGVTRPKPKKFHTAALKNDFVYNYTQADLLKIKMNYLQKTRHLEVDILKQTLLADYLAAQNAPNIRSIVPVEPTFMGHVSKRKQTLEVKTDHGPSVSPATATTAQGAANQKRKSLPLKQPLPVFEGEIIINESSMELLRKMGPRTVADGYARLLPWRVLSDSFSRGAINIWCMVDQTSRLLVNKSDKKAPKNYVDIRQTLQPTEVITWILRNKLPSSYHEENVSFILRETKDNFEICGVCTKNLDTGDKGGKQQRAQSQSPPPLQQEQHPSEPATSCNSPSSIGAPTDDDLSPLSAAGGWLEPGLELKHRDMINRFRALKVCVEKHSPQTLAFEDSAGHRTITVHLPKIGSKYKWRLIHLNSDFSYLYFLKSNYSVKYMDLMIAARMGGKSRDATLMLHSKKLRTVLDHPKMGIYFDHSQPNRVFVGPYEKSNPGSNLVETMRYVNQKLVCTESFNKMCGKEDYRSGFWLVESARDSDDYRDEFTIDLTMDESAPADKCTTEETPTAKTPPSGRRSTRQASTDEAMSSSESTIASVLANVSLTHENAHIEIVEAPPRKPEEFNRFVITNIPHFGYLGAHKHPTSDKIDVSWPFENKLLRFPSVKIATEFLQERFSSLLLPVPETFKIHVIVVNQLDTNANFPIDANVLSGHYICGDFGYYNILTITPHACLAKLNRTRAELLKMFAKRCQIIVRKRSQTLACLLHLKKPTDGDAVAHINNKAVEEINKLKVLEQHLFAQRKEQMMKKRGLATDLFALLSELPEQERSAYSIPFRNILMAKRYVEPIEIASDSDSDADAERGMPVLEAEPRPAPVPTSSSDELPVLEKQVPTHVLPVQQGGINSVIKLRPMKNLSNQWVQKRPLARISESAKWGGQPTATLSPPPSAFQSVVVAATHPRSLLRTANRQQATSTAAAHGKYLKGIKVVKRPNGKFMIVSDANKLAPATAPPPARLTPLAGMKVVLKSKNGGSAEDESPLAMRRLNESLTCDSATRIMDIDDMPAEEQNDHLEMLRNDSSGASLNKPADYNRLSADRPC